MRKSERQKKVTRAATALQERGETTIRLRTDDPAEIQAARDVLREAGQKAGLTRGIATTRRGKLVEGYVA